MNKTIIEITGPPDCGKSIISSVLAKRFNGVSFCFPFLHASAYSSKAIVELLNGKFKGGVESQLALLNANLYEMSEFALDFSDVYKKDIIFFSNYLFAFKCWIKFLNSPSKYTFTAPVYQSKVIYYLDLPAIYVPSSLNSRSSFTRETMKTIMGLQRDNRIINVDHNIKVVDNKVEPVSSRTILTRATNYISKDLSARINAPYSRHFLLPNFNPPMDLSTLI
jgi:hypothetical protein